MKKISAVIIDTYEDKTFASLAIKMVKRLPNISDIFTLSDKPFHDCENLNFIQIDKVKSTNEYGKIIFEYLPNIITNDHALIFQWDGFVLNPQNWCEEFLDYDYIGAVWPQHPLTPVGNGGFSLRSKKLINLLKELNISVDLTNPYDQPEDGIICIHKRSLLEKNGARFSPKNIANKFSFESGRLNRDVLGFHGPQNFPFFFNESDLIRYSDAIVSRLSNPIFMIAYLVGCIGQGMHELVRTTLHDFENKPNLFKTFQYLSAEHPNSPLFTTFQKSIK